VPGERGGKKVLSSWNPVPGAASAESTRRDDANWRLRKGVGVGAFREGEWSVGQSRAIKITCSKNIEKEVGEQCWGKIIGLASMTPEGVSEITGERKNK